MPKFFGCLRFAILVGLTLFFSNVHAESFKIDAKVVKDKVYKTTPYNSGVKLVCLEGEAPKTSFELQKSVEDLSTELNAKSEYSLMCGSLDYEITGSQILPDGLCLFIRVKSVKPTKSRNLNGLQYSCS